ncbi:MAG: methylated-DNA--[protein]-cysteine S-methyltransferase [Spirochaetales bacterium]|nr:methylated-DNA--[protein]-cysteine S-methyltransferase [Spirochaetales bacterium]
MSDLFPPETRSLPGRAEMEAAFMTHDGRWDGLFVAAVTTTGIFCRPSCPARKPKPENVEYYATAREALFSGFRPCLRCRPLEASGDPEWVARLLSLVESEPDRRFRDAELAEAGIDPVAARRFWQRRYGMSFQAYSRARRLGRAFEAIRRGDDLDDAMLERGWESFSGFREAFGDRFGVPPGSAARGASTADFVRLAWIETPLGPMVAGAVGKGVCLLEFSDRRMMEAQLESVRSRFGIPLAPGESPHLSSLRDELAAYFEGRLRAFSTPLALAGSPFEESVWRALGEIPAGETRTYAELAECLGKPGASRAVGHANGRNRVAILVPCHRVVRSGYPGAAALAEAGGGLEDPDAPSALESLGGYGGGLWRKRALLELEAGLRRWTPRPTA